ncbi:MAG: hypothetical protein KKC20_25770 [Proteobacteria bacterium]|jgi:hypothetical protein|nr:hypothetical protein [Pseudomonadota bacterium]
MSIKIEIKTPHFTPKRFSKPWIAKVDFTKSPQGESAWGKWIGDADLGTDGLLVIEGLEPGDVVATGQKDVAGKKTKVEWFQVRGKELVLLSGKVEAYELARKAYEPADKYGDVYLHKSLGSLQPADRNRHLKALKENGLLEQLTVPQAALIMLLLQESFERGQQSAGQK